MGLFSEDEIQNKIKLKADNCVRYALSIIDIDYVIRFAMKLTDIEMEMTMKNMHEFFCNAFPSDAMIAKSVGDEFLVLLPDFSKNEAKRYVNSVKRDFKKIKFALSSNAEYSNITFSFSAGIAVYPEDSINFDEILKQAVTALFMAKAFRRNRVYTMLEPNDRKKPSAQLLLLPDAKVHVLLGRYGEIGQVVDEVDKKNVLFWEPQAIDMDKYGNLYIADQNNHAVLKYDGFKVNRIIGTGSYGYDKEITKASKARLNKPTGITISDDFLYITDTGNDIVHRVELMTGRITVVAGTGEPGYTGDNGQAIHAKLNKPGGAAADNKGNLYINDIANNVIRKLDYQNNITTFAGTGEYGYSGDGEMADQASFREIYGVGIDKKNYRYLYLADYFNHCIRSIDLETNIISTVAGNGECGYEGDGREPSHASLNRPVAVCTDRYGNLFIAESGNHCIRIIPIRENIIMTLAGTGFYGIGTKDEVDEYIFANPNGLVTDDRYHLYVLDGANNRICMIDYSGICIKKEEQYGTGFKNTGDYKENSSK